MLKHHINGTPKKEQGEHCSDCKDGEIFIDHQEIINTNHIGSQNTETICQTCLSKYIIPKKQSLLVTDAPTKHYITTQEVEEFNLNTEELNQENLTLYALKIETLYQQHKDQEGYFGIKIPTKNEPTYLEIDKEQNIRMKNHDKTYQNTLTKLLQKILTNQEKQREQMDRLTPVQVKVQDIRFDINPVKKRGGV